MASEIAAIEIKSRRLALLFVILLATALAAESWERLQSLPYHLGLLSVAVFCVAMAFAGFIYGRRKRVTELKDLVRGFQERTAAPTHEQLDQLGEIIARSQRSFKELIDSFDDIAFATALDGKIKTVNRRVTELLGIPYGDVIGHRIDEFLDDFPTVSKDAAVAALELAKSLLISQLG